MGFGVLEVSCGIFGVVKATTVFIRRNGVFVCACGGCGILFCTQRNRGGILFVSPVKTKPAFT